MSQLQLLVTYIMVNMVRRSMGLRPVDAMKLKDESFALYRHVPAQLDESLMLVIPGVQRPLEPPEHFFKLSPQLTLPTVHFWRQGGTVDKDV